MKDYSAMSDFEINKAVARYEFGSFETCEGEVYVDSKADGANVVPVSGVYDPCNNPANAWPIIIDNRIGFCSTADCWYAHDDGEFASFISDKNPLRAAMIVFLMMKDVENGN